MDLHLGETIKALRKRDNRTQENLAQALGITFQSVSRWETGLAYPDMELIPPIANYFGITIDELFGYECSRDKIIKDLLSRVEGYHYQYDGSDAWVDDCIALLREGLVQFPQNEQLLATLADVLWHAGWRRQDEWLYYNENGYMQHAYDRQKQNRYWTECMKICEYLADNAKNADNMHAAMEMLVMLCRNFGESEKAMQYANLLPSMSRCRELILCGAFEGKEEAAAVGTALLTMAGHFATQVVYGLVNNVHNYETDLPIEKIKGVIAVFNLLCEDGNFGIYNENLIELYLYLSRVQWEREYHDDAFCSLDKALDCARNYAAVCDGTAHFYGGALVKEVQFCVNEIPPHCVRTALPDSWPVWMNPDCSAVEQEIKADPRWSAWVERCKFERSNKP